jgi:hypothetical protein
MEIIPPRSGRAFRIRRGDILRVEDLDGSQVADLVCFNARDHAERFSQSKTRLHAWNLKLEIGSALVSNRNRSMFALLADSVGVHDLLFPPCHSYVYEHMFKVGPRPGCQDNLAAALAPFGLSFDDIPDPLNIFMRTGIDANQALFVGKTPARAGDYVEIRAEMDCLVGLTACADDVTECNGGQCTRIGYAIRAG